MKPIRIALFVLMGLALRTGAETPMRFFRLQSDSNTAVVGMTPGRLTWTNANPAGRFQIEQNLNMATGVWYSFISGPATGAQQALKLLDFSAPTGMVYVPAGDYVRGDIYTNWFREFRAVQVSTVWVSAIYVDRFEVSKSLWDEVRNWALTNGFSATNGIGGVQVRSVITTNDSVITTNWYYYEVSSNHPVVMVTWYDVVKWCNARSLKEGLTPVYYTDTNWVTIYRTGQVDLATNMVNWQASGYRLPTEAEWEKAARGGLIQQHYPWPGTSTDLATTINGTLANYSGSLDELEASTTPIGYYDGAQVVSNDLGDLIVGDDMANPYGLYDMAGNVTERCWDWYSFTTYQWQVQNNDLRDPRGPPVFDPGIQYRVARGGDWLSPVEYLRCAARDLYFPTSARVYLGFRTVRRAPDP